MSRRRPLETRLILSADFEGFDRHLARAATLSWLGLLATVSARFLFPASAM